MHRSRHATRLTYPKLFGPWLWLKSSNKQVCRYWCNIYQPSYLDHDDGLNPPTSKFEATLAFIFLLLDSSSKFLLEEGEAEDPEKIEAEWISALLSFRFLSNFGANFTCLAAATSSSEAGSNRIPSPIFLEAASSSATLFF